MKWCKFLIGLLLLPLVAAQFLTLADLFHAWTFTWQKGAIWLLSFAGGFSLFLALYFMLPPSLWVYVLSHELTHAWAIYLSGGKVFSFKVSNSGGFVKSDTVNWFIALSPYFVPLYSLLWWAIWISIDFYYPLGKWIAIFYGGLGFTWAFHFCFTVQMISIGQTDLSSQGHFFSLVVIAAINLLILITLVIAVSPTLTWRFALHQLGDHSWECYQTTGITIAHWIQMAWERIFLAQSR